MPGNIPLPPPSVIASWPKPNFIDPVRRAWLPPFAMVLQSTASFLVGLRFVLRASKQGGGLGLDDALLVPSWLLSIAFTIIAIAASNDGLVDRHAWDVRVSQYPDMALKGWIAELLFLIGTLCTKMSVLLFYRRLVQGSVSRNWRTAIWAATIFTVVWTFTLVLALILACEPTKAYWKAYDVTWKHEYHCADTTSLNPLSGVLCMISDIYAVALPWLLLRPLQMARRQKQQLNILFGLGLLVAGVSACRAWVLVRFGTDYDLSWTGFDVYVVSLLEYKLGIIVACLPALRALIKFMSERDQLRRNAGESQYVGSRGSSPEFETAPWEGNGTFMYGARNKVVTTGGQASH